MEAILSSVGLEIRRYKQSSFPLWSSLVDYGQTGQNSQKSSFPGLPGNGGKLETRLPRLVNKVSLVALSQEDRNAIVPKDKQSAKYATSARRERAPTRNHENRGKRSRGIVDSDLYHKIGKVGGQNSKPLSRQKSGRKPGKKRESSSSTTLDENERASLENMKHGTRKQFVTNRRHKSHVRESPYAAHQVGTFDQRHRIKSCDRSVSKTNKSLSEVKDEFRRQSREISLKDTEILMKKKQRKADHILDEKVDRAPVATKPRSEKRWKCILVRHSKKSTPIWVGSIPAESWEEECKSPNNPTRLNKLNKKEDATKTEVSNKRYKLKKQEAGEVDLDSTSKEVCSTDQLVSKGSPKKLVKYEGDTEANKNIKIRRNKGQDDKIKKEQYAKKVKGTNNITASSANAFHLSETKIKRSKATENIKAEKILKNVNKKVQLQREKELKKEHCIKSICKQGDNRDIKKHNKGMKVNAVKENAVGFDRKMEQEKNKTEQSDHKNKHTCERKIKFDRHEKKSTKPVELNKTLSKTVDKEKTIRQACKTDAVTTDKRKSQICSSKSKDPKLLIDIKNRKLNTKTIQSSRQDSTDSSFSSSGSTVSNKYMNIKSNDKLNNRASENSTLDKCATPVSKTPFSGRQTRRPSSSRSISSRHKSFMPRRHVSDISIENSRDKNVREKFRQNSAKSLETKRKGLTSSSMPELLPKTITSVITNTSKRNRVIPISKTQAKPVTPVPERSVSQVSSQVSVRSNATKSVASVRGCQESCNSTSSSLVPGCPVSSTSLQRPKSASSRHCSNTRKQQEPIRPSPDCGRSVSAKTISRIPIPSKSTSSVSVRQKTKSASLTSVRSAVTKPITPIHRRPSSSSSNTYVSTRSSTAIPKPLTPVSCRDFTAASKRPVLRCESSTSVKFKSAIPVPIRRGSPISVRSTMASAARSSCATSRLSVSSVSHVSVKSNPSSIHTCIGRASSTSSVRSVPRSNRVQSGHSSVTVQSSHRSERVQSGHSSNRVQSGHSSVTVQSSHRSERVQSGHSSKRVQSSHSSGTVQSSHSSVSTYEDDFEHESFSSCHSESLSKD